jgi:molecular chaperone DnaJ
MDLEIDFHTALCGGEEIVEIFQLQACDTCNASGAKSGSSVYSCRACGGSGQQHSPLMSNLHHGQHQACSVCHGTGQEIEDCCNTCFGSGAIEQSKKMKVTIPPGVKNGNWLCVSGEGDAGPNGGPNGDLWILLEVKEYEPAAEIVKKKVSTEEAKETSKIETVQTTAVPDGGYFSRTWRWMKGAFQTGEAQRHP